jgi:hypothetical protein
MAVALLLRWLESGPVERWRAGLLTAIGALVASSILQIVAILTLRMRTAQFFGHLLHVHAPPSLPGWVLWPLLLVLPFVGLWMCGWRGVAVGLIPAVFATLASEVQRGYITVTDRRLRYAVARRLSLLMRQASNSR